MVPAAPIGNAENPVRSRVDKILDEPREIIDMNRVVERRVRIDDGDVLAAPRLLKNSRQPRTMRAAPEHAGNADRDRRKPLRRLRQQLLAAILARAVRIGIY